MNAMIEEVDAVFYIVFLLMFSSRKSKSCCHLYSHRILWVGRVFEDHLVPTLPTMAANVSGNRGEVELSW